MTPLLTLTEFEPLDGYRLQLSFNDGRTGTVDLASRVTTESRTIIAPLRDLTVFRQVRLEHGSLTWLQGSISPRSSSISWLFGMTQQAIVYLRNPREAQRV